VSLPMYNLPEMRADNGSPADEPMVCTTLRWREVDSNHWSREGRPSCESASNQEPEGFLHYPFDPSLRITARLVPVWRRSGPHLGQRFLPPILSAGYGFRKETIAGTPVNGRDAPIAAICTVRSNGGSGLCNSCHSHDHCTTG
jgi:hypothetical protein